MRHLVIALLLVAAGIQAVAQEAVRLSATTQIQDREILDTEQHHYEFNAEADRFLLLVIEQKGIDLQVTLESPDGDSSSFDSPNGTYGPEIVPIPRTTAGAYQMVVKVLENSPDQQSGHYDLRVRRYEPTADAPEGKIDQLLAAWDRQDSPGASIAVVKNGKVIFKKGYGSANLEYDHPLQPSSVFQVASVSKQFTAFAIATLVTEGKIGLKDPVSKYIAEFPDFGTPVTIEHLVHHTSGLRDLFSFLALAGWHGDDYISKNHILRMVERQRELNFVPGAEYSYSNTGYVLMGEIVARVTGKPFVQWVQENVFTPLQMKSSFINDRYTRIVPNRANAYFASEGEYNNDLLVYSSIGETGLHTTVEDLAKWVINFQTKAVGSDATHALMLQRGILNDGDTISYAFGLRNSEYRGLPIITHSGSHSGYRTFMGYFPEEDLGIIVFSNAGGSISASGTAYGIAEIYMEERMAPKEEAEPEEDEEEPAVFHPENLGIYAGTYFSEEAQTFYEIAVEAEKLILRHARLEDKVLTPVKKHGFKGNSWYIDTVDFVLKEEQVTGFRVSSNRTKNVLFLKK